HLHPPPRGRPPPRVPIPPPPTCPSSPTFPENHRPLVGPPHRRGAHDLSRLPLASVPSSWRTPSRETHPDHRPACSRWPFPTDVAVEALDPSCARPCPSTPTAGVRARNVRSRASRPNR